MFPLGYTAWVSVHDWSLLGGKGDFVGLENYREVLGNPYFTKQLVNTISIFLLSSVPQILIALVLAALLDNQLRGRTMWRMSILLPFVVSPVAVAIIFGSLYGDRYGLVNEVLALVGVDPVAWHTNRFASHVAIATMVNWRWTGYNALIFLAAMQAVPRELYESASIDGASRVRQFTAITVPMIRPTMIFVIITSTIGGLQIFAEPRLFDDTTARNGGSDRQFGTITMLIYDFGWQLRDLGRASATAWLLFLVICVFAVVNFLLIRRVGHQWRRAMSRRPGFLVYGLLIAFVLGSAAPLYWSFLLGSPDQGGRRPGHPAAAAGWPLPRQRPAGARLHPVLEGARQQPAGVDDRPPARSCSSAPWRATPSPSCASGERVPLLVFVIATMAVPTQLGVVPLFILMSKLGWAGSIWSVIIPWHGHRLRRLLHAPVPRRRRARTS